MKSYSLGEWKSILIPEILHSGDQSLLGQLQSSDRLEIDELKEGVRIRAKSWVGVIRFRDFQVQIVPKLAGENLGLIEMVEYCVGISALKRYSSQRYLSLKQQGNLFDLM